MPRIEELHLQLFLCCLKKRIQEQLQADEAGMLLIGGDIPFHLLQKASAWHAQGLIQLPEACNHIIHVARLV
jgi:hypothetical protein